MDFPGSSDGKESACNVGDLGSVLGWEDPLYKGVASGSSILAWRIPWTEEPGRLQSMESQSQTPLSYFHFLIRNGLDAFKNSRVFRVGISSSPFYLFFPMFSPGIWNI